MKKNNGLVLIVTSIICWLAFGLLLPIISSFGTLPDSNDKTNYLGMTITILAAFGCAVGINSLEKRAKWHAYLVKFLIAFLIIPAGVFFIGNVIVRGFNLQPTDEPFSIVAAVLYLISLGLGIWLIKRTHPIDVLSKLGS